MNRWLIVTLALGIVGFLTWMLWPRSQTSASAPTSAAVTIQAASPAQAATAQPMSTLMLEEIRSDMVSYFTEQNGRWVLTFLDGSKREVYPFEIDQLPEQLQLQMRYKRGGS